MTKSERAKFEKLVEDLRYESTYAIGTQLEYSLCAAASAIEKILNGDR